MEEGAYVIAYNNMQNGVFYIRLHIILSAYSLKKINIPSVYTLKKCNLIHYKMEIIIAFLTGAFIMFTVAMRLKVELMRQIDELKDFDTWKEWKNK